MHVQEEESYKIVVLGDSGAGKTSVILRYAKECFQPRYSTTIGASVIIKTLPEYNNASLKIWDTAGQERYRSLVPMCCHGADAILIIFDLNANFYPSSNLLPNINLVSSNTNHALTQDESVNLNKASSLNALSHMNDNSRATFQEAIDCWIHYIEENIDIENTPIFIAGNKLDLIENEQEALRKFRRDEQCRLVDDNNLPVFLVSAKNGKNISELFSYIAESLIGSDKMTSNNKVPTYQNSNDVQDHKCCS